MHTAQAEMYEKRGDWVSLDHYASGLCFPVKDAAGLDLHVQNKQLFEVNEYCPMAVRWTRSA
jgi:hypothetical protein